MFEQHNPHPRIVQPEDCVAGCTCGKVHPIPDTTVYSGSDACRRLAKDCQAAYGSRPVLMICDPDTEEVAGHLLIKELDARRVNLSVYRLDASPSATDTLAEKLQAASANMSLIITVGSGTINDLGKFTADRIGIDYWSMPTAPSMNGYTSSIAAIKVRGVKQTLPARPPKRLYVIPDVIQRAPVKLRQAGYCDVLAKAVSDIDWQCESLLFSHSYCSLPASMLTAIEDSYANRPEAIGQEEEQAVTGLLNGLLRSGVAMSLAGSSAPASGGEHLVSHFWDMREPLTGREPELHGLQVGIGIILSTACYKRLASLEATTLRPCAERIFAATAAQIPEIWGKYADEVEQQFNKKKRTLAQFDALLPAHWTELQALFRKVEAPEYFLDLFLRTGAPFTLDAFRLTSEEFLLAALNSRAIRERITVLDLAAHTGILEAAAMDTIKLLS